MMTSKQARQLPKYAPNPIFKGLPKKLKDPRNFMRIQRALLETLATRHSHSELLDFYQCPSCMRKVQDHKAMMLKLGFTSPAQYREWVRVHEVIRRRVPYPKYDDYGK